MHSAPVSVEVLQSANSRMSDCRWHPRWSSVRKKKALNPWTFHQQERDWTYKLTNPTIPNSVISSQLHAWFYWVQQCAFINLMDRMTPCEHLLTTISQPQSDQTLDQTKQPLEGEIDASVFQICPHIHLIFTANYSTITAVNSVSYAIKLLWYCSMLQVELLYWTVTLQ